MKLRLVPAVMAALLASFVMAAAASAAPPTVTVTSNKASFSDDGSNADQLKVSIAPGQLPQTVNYTFTDSVSMTSGNPLACMPSSGTTIVCTVPGGAGVNVTLGDAPNHASQSVAFTGTGWAGQANKATGGSGDDEFDGADSADTFVGGPGADTFDGGAAGTGKDTVDYSGETKDVFAAIDDANDSGVGCPSSPACEHDTIASGGIVNLTGGAGNDTLVGNSAVNTLNGGDGNNLLLGGAGVDTLTGGAGNDDLDGGLGADTLNGGGGSNTVDYSNDGRTSGVNVHLESSTTSDGDTLTSIENAIGTPFNDGFTGDANANVFHGGAGDDNFAPGDGADEIFGGDGSLDAMHYADHTSGSTGVTVSLDDKANDGSAGENDNVHLDVEQVTGSTQDDTFLAGPASESFRGDGGTDTLSFANLTVPVDGHLGGTSTAGGNTYKIVGSSGTDTIKNMTGGSADDVLTGTDQGETLSGGPGNDDLRGGLGADHLNGDAGSDTADYGADARKTGVSVDLNSGTQSQLTATPTAEDTSLNSIENVIGTGFDDTLSGDGANNQLSGGGGNDILRGRGANDLLTPGAGADTVSGGGGVDIVDYSDHSNPVNLTLDGTANDGADGEKDNVATDVEGAIGGGGDDTLAANPAANAIVANIFDGGPGNDTITSLAGNDTVTGGSGKDNVDAGAGDDTLNLVDAEADTANCGDGNDTVNADPIDVLTGCEKVNVTASSSTPPTPSTSALSITDAQLKEGNAGTRTMTFTVALNAPQAAAVSVPYATADITAKAPSDYKAASGTLTFNPGETSKTIGVTIVGDKRYERNETFALALGKPVGNATLPLKFYGTGTIVNDDKKPKRKPRPVAFSVRVTPKRDTTAPYGFRLSGRIGIPGGVSARRACAGKVAVVVVVDGKSALHRVRVSRSCSFAFRYGTSKRPKNGDVTFRVQFLGNKVLSKTKRKTLHARAG